MRDHSRRGGENVRAAPRQRLPMPIRQGCRPFRLRVLDAASRQPVLLPGLRQLSSDVHGVQRDLREDLLCHEEG